MASIAEICSDVRLRLNEPRPQAVSPRRVLLSVLDSLQTFYARLGNSGQNWSIKQDYILNVTSGTSDFLLAIDSSYGKPIQVLTYYPTNPSYAVRYVQFTEMQNLNFDWGLPQNIASWAYNDGSPNTAMRIAFYQQDDGSRWCRVLPQPQLSAQYAVTFQSADWTASAGLESEPALGQFHSLVEVWAAKSCLPACEWWDDQTMNERRQKALLITLQGDEDRIRPDFETYIRNLTGEHMTTRVPGVAIDEDWW